MKLYLEEIKEFSSHLLGVGAPVERIAKAYIATKGAEVRIELEVDISADRARQEAEWLIRACNAHDALVEAIEAVVGRTFPEDPVGKMLRAALAKAQGVTL